MSIKLRFMLLLGLLLAGFLGALAWLRYLERTELRSLLADERDTRAQLLNHWIDQTTRALPQVAADLAQSEDLQTLQMQPDAAPLRQKITQALASAGVAELWMLRGDGTVRLHLGTSGEPPAAFPVEPAETAALVAETPSPRFFAERGRELWEICIRRSAGASRDWIALGRRWDEAQLRALAQLTESVVELRHPTELAQPPAETGQIALVRPLADARGRVLRVLHLQHATTEIDRTLRADWRQAQVFLAFGLMVIAAMALALRAWVLRPLGRISESLASGDTGAAREVSFERNELGRIAQLVLSSSAQRETLEREVAERSRAQAALERSEAALRENLEERARLGRDLHDGVIQSLYAAGMGLAGIRAQLRSDQAEAAGRLEQTRDALNETIRDVRNFIMGLEPEALKLQTFGQAVSALIDVMRGIRAFEAHVTIDEDLAGRLTLAQRVHALQIIREALSNALRHGAASRVDVALRVRDALAEVEISDNGRGFDVSSSPPPQGHGLANFAQRARELGGILNVESTPGLGTRVKLTFSRSLL